MRISKVDIIEVALPLLHPLKTGFGDIYTKPNIIVRLTTRDGKIGYGEAATLQAPIYTYESAETCKIILEKHIGPRILGKDFENPQDFRKAYSDIIGNNLAKTGVELAFWDLFAQQQNKSLKDLFGGVQDQISVGESVGITDEISELISAIEQMLDHGFVRIKVKIKPGWDEEPLRAVRKRWPEIELSADANSSYDYDKHKDTLVALDEFKLSMLEQPFAYNDFIGHAKLQAKMKTPICLDESIQDLNDAKTAVALKSCQIINIKPGRVGGIVESIAIHDFCAENNIGVWCGGMLETGIGRAFNVALASKSNFIYPADMSPKNAYYSDDLTEPKLELNSQGSIDVSKKIGLGYKVSEDKLKQFSVDTRTLKA